MAGKSSKTVSFGLRLPIELAQKIDKRVREYPGDISRNDYIRRRLLYDLNRQHKRYREKGETQ